MKTLNTENLEWGGVEKLSYVNIVEVALRHGFDPELKDEFLNWVEELVREHVNYVEWETYMGDDL